MSTARAALRERLERAGCFGAFPKLILKIVVIAPLVLAVLSAVFITYSNQPKFCVSCHYMQPFYDAWEKSSHNHVKCVDCHIPPGAKSWLKHKAAAAVQVVKYVTRQYGMRPWVEVDDASCLRSGCHETRLLAGKVQFGGVTFDHAPHLTSFRRVTRMRCTSCHAQIVQGSHMMVTEGTCFLCHFKNTDEAPEMAKCQRCHTEIKKHQRTDIPSEAWVKQHPPKTESVAPSYDHEDVLERQVDCHYCHNDVVQGKGEVPKDRCLNCHTEPERLERYSDIEFMHRNHVTDHKVDCLRCHVEIQHALPPKEQTPELQCATCHPQQHEATKQLYRGQSGSGAKPQGNPMYDVRVPCEGCHLQHAPVDGRPVDTTAGAAGCMLCHGEKFGQRLTNWQADAVTWTNWADKGLAATERALDQIGSAAATAQVKAHLRTARDNVAAVRNGKFIHNPDYAKSLLAVARQEANQALEQAGAGYRWPAAPASSTAEATGPTCAKCHSDITRSRVFAFGVMFDHGLHVGQHSLPCTTCHLDGSRPQQAGHGRLVVGRQNCQQCHTRSRLNSPHPDGWKILHSGAAQQNREVCSTCHQQSFCDNCHGVRIPHADDWPRKHKQMRGHTDVCAKCHRASFCDACHQIAPPADHDGSWARRHGGQAQADPQRCARCHNQATCTSCHGLTLPHDAKFKNGGHAARVKQSPEVCARCHTSDNCLKCHTGKPPADHKAEQWQAGHGVNGQGSPKTCTLCHGEDACRSCHGLTMPHPTDWAIRRHASTAKAQPALCQRCHQQSYCAKCHDSSGEEKP